MKTKTKSKVKANGATPRLLSKISGWPKMVKIIAVVVLLAGLGFAGTYGYGKWKANDLKAEAASWSLIYAKSGHIGWACQKPINSVTTELRAVVGRPLSGGSHYARLDTFNRKKRPQGGDYSTSWWGGNVTALKVYMDPDGWYRLQTAKGGGTQYSILFTQYCSDVGGK